MPDAGTQDRAAPRTEAAELLRYLWDAELPIAAALRAQQAVGDAMTVRDVFLHGTEGDPLVTDIDVALAEREAAAPQIDVARLAAAAQDHETPGIHGQLHCSLACGATLAAAYNASAPPLAAGAGDPDPLEIERLRSKAWQAEADALIRENARLRDIVEGAAGDRDRREARLREAARTVAGVWTGVIGDVSVDAAIQGLIDALMVVADPAEPVEADPWATPLPPAVGPPASGDEG